MPKITREDVRVPLDVMPESREEYIDNYMKATQGTGRLMLFACDQKIEHLNKDFFGEGIDPADADPEHLFKIGSQGVCGVLAGQLGLIARYAQEPVSAPYRYDARTSRSRSKNSPFDGFELYGRLVDLPQGEN